ncbi:hypothetical protein LSH36_1199g00015 [Paralvinella palmiformis]|uniref:Uncharacterized protein n=1 Tax=Paralvinella palmiformis TaxID=53620 RepID=A0AAD9IUR4_9ANNE|nr:hypothetical protein LSH36_1199g00015 [Paralvinella palmiformis]
MYASKFLRSSRIVVAKDATFVCERVSAEMQKKYVYKVDITVDKLGVVQESQCGCAAGMGPDGHLALVLYAIAKVNDGTITMETRTQQLQAFHQAKKYNGSPVKMEEGKVCFHELWANTSKTF